MQTNKQKVEEVLAELQRLGQWSRVADDLATCPIEELGFTGGRITFFVDTRRCAEPPLPGFATAAKTVLDLTVDERHRLARYLVRRHKERFACAARTVTGSGRVGWPEVHIIGDEVEFSLSAGFVREALEITK